MLLFELATDEGLVTQPRQFVGLSHRVGIHDVFGQSRFDAFLARRPKKRCRVNQNHGSGLMQLLPPNLEPAVHLMRMSKLAARHEKRTLQILNDATLHLKTHEILRAEWRGALHCWLRALIPSGARDGVARGSGGRMRWGVKRSTGGSAQYLGWNNVGRMAGQGRCTGPVRLRMVCLKTAWTLRRRAPRAGG
jgi:hypothetical protein